MEKGNNKLAPSQLAALEILDVVHEICERHGLSYCLLGAAMLAIKSRNGFLPWMPRLAVAMFYDEYKKFIDICKTELEGTGYYIISSENAEQFYELCIRVAKRGRVKLGEGREKDEMYYDFYIVIQPIFYAGNTMKEHNELKRIFLEYKKIIDLSLTAPGWIWTYGLNLKAYIGYIRKRILNMLHYKEKDTINPKRTLEKLARFKEPTKYVFIPEFANRYEIQQVAWQYTGKKKYMFEGREYYGVADIEQYVSGIWGDNYKEALTKRSVNQAEFEGGEILRRIQLVELDMLIEFDRICRKYDIKYIIAAGTALGAVRHKGFVPWDDDVDVFMLYEEYKRFLEVADSELDHDKYFLKTQESDKDCNLTFAQLKRNGTVYTKADRESFDTHPGAPLDIHPIFNAHPIRPVAWCIDKICKYYKTMTWAHIGAAGEKDPKKKKRYTRMARKGNKYAYSKFMKYASMVKKETSQLSNFYIARNLYSNPTNKRFVFEDIEEVEFEGRKFYATKHMDYYLSYSYSKEYMRFPILRKRVQSHIPAIVDVGDLYEDLKFEEEKV